MGKEIFINYWIGEETYGTLNTMPAYVDIAPLAFAHINKDLELDFSDFAVSGMETVIGWTQLIQTNKTKVLLSIASAQLGTITGSDLDKFVKNVLKTVDLMGLDGLDFDYEPTDFGNGQGENLTALVATFRKALNPGSILTMPIWQAWRGQNAHLSALAQYIDYFTTMDYTGYPGYDSTISYCSSYADAVGWEKLAIGMSCMGPQDRDWITPIEDVVKLCRYEPGNGKTKAGAMLYTFNYDRRWRTSKTNPGTGTNYSNQTWTETIHANLP